MNKLCGCDVSTFQDPALVNWNDFDFGIVRATYGTKQDSKSKAHAAKIRAARKELGLYHFFLPNTDLQKQLDAFCAVADAVHLGTGDILPCVDIERYPDQFKDRVATRFCEVSTEWAHPLRNFVDLLEARYGGCVLYITQRDWVLLGQPAWVLERPLWVANYPKAGATSPLKAPATPGNKPYAIWQCLVGPLGKSIQDPNNPRAVDQNVALEVLPLISGDSLRPDKEVPSHGARAANPASLAADILAESNAIPFVTLSEDDWAEMRNARDRHVREHEVV